MKLNSNNVPFVPINWLSLIRKLFYSQFGENFCHFCQISDGRTSRTSTPLKLTLLNNSLIALNTYEFSPNHSSSDKLTWLDIFRNNISTEIILGESVIGRYFSKHVVSPRVVSNINALYSSYLRAKTGEKCHWKLIIN